MKNAFLNVEHSECEKKGDTIMAVSNVANFENENKTVFFFGKGYFLPYLVNMLISCCWLHCGHFFYYPH